MENYLLLPQPENAVSGTVVPAAVADQETVAVPVSRLSTIMSELGHERLDVLKMDIEGAEYAVLDDMLRRYLARPITRGIPPW